jgi:ribosome modulation factor
MIMRFLNIAELRGMKQELGGRRQDRCAYTDI